MLELYFIPALILLLLLTSEMKPANLVNLKLLNLFLANVLFLNPLKTSEN